MRPRRDNRQLLLGIAALTLALTSLTLLGVDSEVLLMAPALMLALPLLMGRFVGEEQIARLAFAFGADRRRPASMLAPAMRRSPCFVPRGGRLIAASLAVRPPPATAL